MYPILLYIRQSPNIYFLSMSIICNAANWFWLLWNIRPREDLIFLHYNVLFGVDLIGPWIHILYVPLLGLIILLVNAAIGWYFFRKDKFVGYIFNAVASLSQILLFIVGALLVFLNV